MKFVSSFRHSRPAPGAQRPPSATRPASERSRAGLLCASEFLCAPQGNQEPLPGLRPPAIRQESSGAHSAARSGYDSARLWFEEGGDTWREPTETLAAAGCVVDIYSEKLVGISWPASTDVLKSLERMEAEGLLANSHIRGLSREPSSDGLAETHCDPLPSPVPAPVIAADLPVRSVRLGNAWVILRPAAPSPR